MIKIRSLAFTGKSGIDVLFKPKNVIFFIASTEDITKRLLRHYSKEYKKKKRKENTQLEI